MKASHLPGLIDIAWSEDPSIESQAVQGSFDVRAEPSGQRRFWFVCPGACKSLSAIALRPVVDGSPQSWDFDGNMQAPTLSPSINHVGCWHGWLRNGEFVL
jgi:hypothetical protein